VSRYPEPFQRARAGLTPTLEACGFRLLSLEHEEEGNGNAFAEFGRRGLRLRLVWENRERALWVEAARTEGAQVVSRWTDIEWAVAGERLPLNHNLTESRTATLLQALGRFLADQRP
jgi:hypothetical protein